MVEKPKWSVVLAARGNIRIDEESGFPMGPLLGAVR